LTFKVSKWYYTPLIPENLTIRGTFND